MRIVIAAVIAALFIFAPAARVEAQSCDITIPGDDPGWVMRGDGHRYDYIFSPPREIRSIIVDASIAPELLSVALLQWDPWVEVYQDVLPYSSETLFLADEINIYATSSSNIFTLNSVTFSCNALGSSPTATPTTPAPTPVPDSTVTPRPMLPPPDINLTTAYTGISHFFVPFFLLFIVLFMIMPALVVLRGLVLIVRDAFNGD